jgi:hypothetical protein
LSLQVPLTAQLARPKAFFYFYSPLNTILQFPTVSDTTSRTMVAVQRVNIKTYTINVPTGADRMRILIYGYISTGSGTVWLNINGTDVQSVTVSNTTEALLIDYMTPITPGTYTINIDGNPGGNNLVISKVFIATGMSLTSTTTTTIATFTLTYQILRQGNIRYSPGVRVFVFGNRKTTAPLTLTIPEATSIITGRNNLGAGNDNDKAEIALAVLTGSVTFNEGGEFSISVTLRGNVGAVGDTIIITRIQARAQLRREVNTVGEVRVYERGVVEYACRALLVSGFGDFVGHAFSRRDIQDRFLAWINISGSGGDVTVFNIRVAVVAPVHFTSAFDEDYVGGGFFEWVQVVVWG